MAVEPIELMAGLSRWSAPMRRFSTGVCAVAFATVVAVLMTPGVAPAEPPGIPSAAAARALLAALTVADETTMSGYSRNKFPHWIIVSGDCDTRERVLQRDGTGVRVDAKCHPTAGSWYSPYDGKTVRDVSGVDIDHVVPLAEAWRSGAREWSTAQREKFANDLDNPQLIAVTASSNRSKGDQDPASWLPPNASYRCTYTRMWVAVKSTWRLTLQHTEKTALGKALQSC
ncbi:HNH endonuclease family protein [Nocardia sp. CDC159]|uniref:HNH endonuclease family protein n=1 Tax=Nocardia pulmonis TaxID=2951408 RepID=A0A9X2IV47_9NOCA|nr:MULTISPECIES: HNH endonuclease family protein [Nocardia]MCM6773512.1 HNH endonuclease family protein [Nocardia pulmonis]MCM6786399.1 HNH endonuclease family protein [Nocardia sp. CDC159]